MITRASVVVVVDLVDRDCRWLRRLLGFAPVAYALR